MLSSAGITSVESCGIDPYQRRVGTMSLFTADCSSTLPQLTGSNHSQGLNNCHEGDWTLSFVKVQYPIRISFLDTTIHYHKDHLAGVKRYLSRRWVRWGTKELVQSRSSTALLGRMKIRCSPHQRRSAPDTLAEEGLLDNQITQWPKGIHLRNRFLVHPKQRLAFSRLAFLSACSTVW